MNVHLDQKEKKNKRVLLFDTDSFTFQTCLLATITIFLFAFLGIRSNFSVFLLFAIYIAVFYIMEINVSKTIMEIYKGSKFFQKSTKHLLFFCLASLVYFFYLLYFHERILNFQNPNSYSSSFYRSIYLSIQIFSLSTTIKAFLVGFQIVSKNFIRSGFFSIYQLFFCLIRFIFVTRIWICYIKHHMIYFVLSMIMYILIKIYAFYSICFEIFRSSKHFFHNRKNQFPDYHNEPSYGCMICFAEKIVEPKVLPCGHMFCYKCIHRWVQHNQICPLCRAQTIAPLPLDMVNGYIPFFVFLCVF